MEFAFFKQKKSTELKKKLHIKPQKAKDKRDQILRLLLKKNKNKNHQEPYKSLHYVPYSKLLEILLHL